MPFKSTALNTKSSPYFTQEEMVLHGIHFQISILKELQPSVAFQSAGSFTIFTQKQGSPEFKYSCLKLCRGRLVKSCTHYSKVSPTTFILGLTYKVWAKGLQPPSVHASSEAKPPTCLPPIHSHLMGVSLVPFLLSNAASMQLVSSDQSRLLNSLPPV